MYDLDEAVVPTVMADHQAAMQAMRLGTALTPITMTASSQQSAVIGMPLVMLQSTMDAHAVIGANPTATTSSTIIFAGVPYIFACRVTDKVAVLQDNGTGGVFYITPAGR